MMEDRLLDRISIASPCTADWNAMQGDERTRFCGQCRLHVHDLSAMTADEATALLRSAGQGRVCVRFYRRADGRVLTRDCPVGLRQRLRRTWARAAAMLLALWGSAVACVRQKPAQPQAPATAPATPTPIERRMGEVSVEMGDFAPAPAPTPVPTPTEQGRVLMGKPQAAPAPSSQPPAK